ncbi:hypothetical protein F511_30117 [Dorcoceras hygrometricum]|uniref:Uncharacterized protein n=1 Tax=Dorcoceras hygrometricum TaxID=472368 RepID=A0A2Z7ATL8_9LAMI|nr:hypothetical protein F511_30117 [Dorcoceras hygrometricum]
MQMDGLPDELSSYPRSDSPSGYQPISSGLIVQADEGIPSPIVDLIDVVYRNLS